MHVDSYKPWAAVVAAIATLLSPVAARAQSACPSGADYLDGSEGYHPVTLARLGVTSCYYVSASGSDANAGTKASPWQHLPGMPGCAANCLAKQTSGPQPGEGYLLHGGDTWKSPNLGIAWNWHGTATNVLYVGVDFTWFAGTAWTRPVFDGQGTFGGTFLTLAENNAAQGNGSAFTHVDEIEMKGLFSTDFLSAPGPSYVNACGSDVVERLYLHGWGHGTPPTGHNPLGQAISGGCGSGTNRMSTVRFNIIDGSDTSRDSFTGITGSWHSVIGNYVQYVNTGIDGAFDIVHDNVIYWLMSCIVTCHQDGIYQQGWAFDPTNDLFYNNVVGHINQPYMGGSGKYWMTSNISDGSVFGTGYMFNNVLYDNLSGNNVSFHGHNNANFGTWYAFNNSVDDGTDSQQGDISFLSDDGVFVQNQATASLAQHSINNHYVSNSLSMVSCSLPHFDCTTAHDLPQSFATANGQGYVDTAAYAWRPVSAHAATVGAGADQTSLCSAISTFNQAGAAACARSTTYGVAYDTANHTLTFPALAPVGRPSGRWDVGAYQYGSESPPSAPTQLTATVH